MGRACPLSAPRAAPRLRRDTAAASYRFAVAAMRLHSLKTGPPTREQGMVSRRIDNRLEVGGRLAAASEKPRERTEARVCREGRERRTRILGARKALQEQADWIEKARGGDGTQIKETREAMRRSPRRSGARGGV